MRMVVLVGGNTPTVGVRVAGQVLATLHHQRILCVNQCTFDLCGLVSAETVKTTHWLAIAFSPTEPAYINIRIPEELSAIMTPQPSDLFEAFKQDHAILGRGLHELSAHLRGGDPTAAKSVAERVDREAGAHIAFEEEFFYPTLRRLLGDSEVDRLHTEHDMGLSVIKTLLKMPEDTTPSEDERRTLLKNAELMEAHVAECGELFGAMGRIPPEEQKALYLELLTLREMAPRWTTFAASPERKKTARE